MLGATKPWCFTSFLHQTAGIYHVVLVSNPQRFIKKHRYFFRKNLHSLHILGSLFLHRETSLKWPTSGQDSFAAAVFAPGWIYRADGPQKLFFVGLVGLKESDVFFSLKRKCSPPKPLVILHFCWGEGGWIETLGISNFFFFGKMNSKGS